MIIVFSRPILSNRECTLLVLLPCQDIFQVNIDFRFDFWKRFGIEAEPGKGLKNDSTDEFDSSNSYELYIYTYISPIHLCHKHQNHTF